MKKGNNLLLKKNWYVMEGHESFFNWLIDASRKLEQINKQDGQKLHF